MITNVRRFMHKGQVYYAWDEHVVCGAAFEVVYLMVGKHDPRSGYNQPAPLTRGGQLYKGSVPPCP